jgi:hypothetical protein
LFFAASRQVCNTIRFDEATFDGFHFYDLDFTYRAFLAGFQLAVAWDILIIHDSIGSITSAAWTRYSEKFAAKFRGRLPVNTTAQPRCASVRFANEAEATAFHQWMSSVLLPSSQETPAIGQGTN